MNVQTNACSKEKQISLIISDITAIVRANKKATSSALL